MCRSHLPTTGSLAGGALGFQGTNLLPESPDPLQLATSVTPAGWRHPARTVVIGTARVPHTPVHGFRAWVLMGCLPENQGGTTGVIQAGKMWPFRCSGPAATLWARGTQRHGIALDPTRIDTAASHTAGRLRSRASRMRRLGIPTAAWCDMRWRLLGRDTGERFDPALKRFERVLVGGHICKLSKPTCDGLTRSSAPPCTCQSHLRSLSRL